MVSVENFTGLLRERILENAREVEELSRLPLQPASFFRQFLRRTISAIGARCGTVWLRDAEGRLQKCAHVGMSQSDAVGDPKSVSQNETLLTTILSSGEARCLPDDDDENPFDELLYLSPLHVGENCVGVLQILQGPGATSNARQGQLQFIEQMAGFASQFLSRIESQVADSAITQDFWADLSELTLRLQSSLEFKRVA